MAIEFQCSCGAPLSALESQAGETVRCEACGREVPVPAAGGADELVSQMRAVRDDRLGAQPVVPPVPGTAPRGAPRRGPTKPQTAVQRAATHLRFKQAMWVPALVVGLLCTLLAVVSLVTGVVKVVAAPDAPAGDDLEVGAVFEDERGEMWKIIAGEDGRKWLVPPQAKVTWDDGRPVATQDGFDMPVHAAEESMKFRSRVHYQAAKTQAAEHARGRGWGYLIFGVGFLVVGPALLGLSLWMRRDVRLVAAAEGAAAAE